MKTASFETRGAAGAVVRMDLDEPGVEDAPLRGWVVLIHGFKGFASWGFFPDLAQRITELGFLVLRVDLSHNGTGRGADRDEFTRLDLFEQDRVSYRLADLSAALTAAGQRDSRLGKLPRALFGHSLGGGLALLAAERTRVHALITLSSVGSLELRPEAVEAIERGGHWDVLNARTNQVMRVGAAALRDIRANAELYDLETIAGRITIPWLLLHGDADESVPLESGLRLHGASKGRARLTILPGGDHTLGCKHPFEGPTPHYEEAWARIADFLKECFPTQA